GFSGALGRAAYAACYGVGFGVALPVCVVGLAFRPMNNALTRGLRDGATAADEGAERALGWMRGKTPAIPRRKVAPAMAPASATCGSGPARPRGFPRASALEEVAEDRLGEAEEPSRGAGGFEPAGEHGLHPLLTPGLTAFEEFQEGVAGEARQVGHRHGLDDPAGG